MYKFIRTLIEFIWFVRLPDTERKRLIRERSAAIAATRTPQLDPESSPRYPTFCRIIFPDGSWQLGEII